MSIRLLIFFTMYVMFYIGAWFWKMKLMSDLLYYFIPVVAVVFLNFIKHIVELYKNGDNGCCLGKEMCSLNQSHCFVSLLVSCCDILHGCLS